MNTNNEKEREIINMIITANINVILKNIKKYYLNDENLKKIQLSIQRNY